jgi:hypothetical protein
VLHDDDELLALAATIPSHKLPPLLFEAAATFLVLTLEPQPLRDWFPRVGEPQAPLHPRFADAYRAFCLEHRHELLELCAEHRYQMNEVGRCAAVVPALAPAVQDGRELALVDLGTGAGLALHLDRYRYSYRFGVSDGSRDQTVSVGDPSSSVVIETEARGRAAPPIVPSLPLLVDRVGIDIEPLDLTDQTVRAWLAACIPQEIGAVTRFHRAAELAIANPARLVRGDAIDVLEDVLGSIPEGPTVCLLDAYVHVFFEPQQLQAFRALVDRIGAERDLDWISIDPLVPMGPSATKHVLGIPVPPSLIERNHREGVFGVVGRLTYRGGGASGALIGIAHPGAAWLEWLVDGAG